MNVCSAGTCAPSHDACEWHSIDWVKAHRNVRRLQARIVKATREERWGKVKALQWMLTHAFSAKAIAVKRVTDNRGKNTAGVDRETWSSPAAKATGLSSLKRRGYKPAPLRRVSIPKKNGKTRPLGIPTMRDRAMQALHSLALAPVAETTADPNSYGFRSGRATADAREQIHTLLAQKRAAEWILEADIQGCFDNISHDWLLRNIPMDKRVLQSWLKAGFIENGAWQATEAGTPQGGIISPTLANMTLDGLERAIIKEFPKRMVVKIDGKWVKKGFRKVHVVRYADDFIITGSSESLLKDEVKPFVEEFLAKRGLTLSSEKTKITHISDGFDFLGWNVRKYDGTLLIKPSKDSYKSVMGKIRETVKANKTSTQESLVMKLNPIVRGWAEYHRVAVSSEMFAKADNEVFTLLWRWAKRRHPKKSPIWIKEKYFPRSKNRNWAFNNGMPIDAGGKHLRWFTDTKIVRHTKVKSEANFYDPEWDAYFDKRISLKMAASLKGRRKVSALWRQQKGKCIGCGERITFDTGWHVHHVRGRSIPNAEALTNLELLHPGCHMQRHHRRWLPAQ